MTQESPDEPTIGRRSRRVRVLIQGVISAVILLLALRLFPVGSDAEYALFDPVWYASVVEKDGVHTCVGQHPLFHAAAALIHEILTRFGVPNAGTYSVRVLGGLGLVLIVLGLVSLAGASRLAMSLLLILVLCSMRGVFLEAMAGENVLLAVAFALLVFIEFQRRPPRPLIWIPLLVLALLLRQDNVLLVPVLFVTALLQPQDHGRRRRVLVHFLLAGLLTALGYLIFWKVGGRDLSLRHFLFEVGESHPAAGLTDGAPSLVQRRFAALGFAVVGRQGAVFDHALHAALGLGTLALAAIGCVVVSGGARVRRILMPVLAVTILRFPFYAYFEPDNPEWWLFDIVFLAAVGASALQGPRTARPAVMRAGGLLFILLALGVLLLHGVETLRLRERKLSRAAELAVSVAGPEVRAYGFQNRGVLALQTAGSRNLRHLPADLDAAHRRVLEDLERERVPTLLLIDLAVQNGYPADLRELRRKYGGNAAPDFPGVRILHHQNGVSVVGFFLP